MEHQNFTDADVRKAISLFDVPPCILDLVPEARARANLIVPLALNQGTLTLAAPKADDPGLAGKLRSMLNKRIQLVAVPREQLEEALNRLYGPLDTEAVCAIHWM